MLGVLNIKYQDLPLTDEVPNGVKVTNVAHKLEEVPLSVLDEIVGGMLDDGLQVDVTIKQKVQRVED